MRVFWHQGLQEDGKSTEETAKKINLSWEFFWHQGPQEDRKSTEETETKKINLRWEFFDTKAHKETERAQKRQFIDTKAHKKTEKAQKRQKQKDGSFFNTKAHKKTERAQKRQKQSNKKRVFGHQGPQEDWKSTEETETKQINLRWEFFDTKAHKKTERAQKRQKQSKPT